METLKQIIKKDGSPGSKSMSNTRKLSFLHASECAFMTGRHLQTSAKIQVSDISAAIFLPPEKVRLPKEIYSRQTITIIRQTERSTQKNTQAMLRKIVRKRLFQSSLGLLRVPVRRKRIMRIQQNLFCFFHSVYLTFSFCMYYNTQYVYYAFESLLTALIVAHGQTALENRFGRTKWIPYGGIEIIYVVQGKQDFPVVRFP